MKLEELIDFNPITRLNKGAIGPFITMASLPTSDRHIPNFFNKVFSGSGSKFRDGDTLFARITPCLENGKGGFVRGLGHGVVGHGSTEFIVFRAKSSPDENFVYYISRLQDFRTFAVQQMSGTSGRQRVNWQSLARYEIADLDLEERVAIGDLLTTLDENIDLNRRNNETLEATARAIFKDWFVDFGPTRAKVEGRKPYLAPEIWDLFPDGLDDDDKPVGWRIGQVQELVEINPKESLSQNTVSPYLEMAALPTTGCIPDTPIDRAFKSGTKFRNGDTLIARITPCLENGKTAFIQCLSDEVIAWGSTEFIVMRSKSPVPMPYSYILAREFNFRTHAIQSMTGTSGRQRARSEALAEYSVVIPNDPIWQAFGNIIDPIFNRIAANGAESLTLSQTRDLLLPKLMSGEIRLRDAEKEVEAVV